MTQGYNIRTRGSRKPSQPKVSEFFKGAVEQEVKKFIETTLKPQHVQPPPEGSDFNYIVDIYGKWYGNKFNFFAKYACPSPKADSPSFEEKFARLECTDRRDQFNLAFMRHTGEWITLYSEMSLSECLETLAKDPLFTP